MLDAWAQPIQPSSPSSEPTSPSQYITVASNFAAVPINPEHITASPASSTGTVRWPARATSGGVPRVPSPSPTLTNLITAHRGVYIARVITPHSPKSAPLGNSAMTLLPEQLSASASETDNRWPVPRHHHRFQPVPHLRPDRPNRTGRHPQRGRDPAHSQPPSHCPMQPPGAISEPRLTNNQ